MGSRRHLQDSTRAYICMYAYIGKCVTFRQSLFRLRIYCCGDSLVGTVVLGTRCGLGSNPCIVKFPFVLGASQPSGGVPNGDTTEIYRG